ncbi:phosphatidylglycerol lysyltransferase domain-containing protein [Sphingobacterium sp. Mn56C]|uniref:phosphatidylglycerol lysyltransferase domain-containing protein n=1 Tax=Sphingobacterium sp. Mn56C TaxID=3395261 RepID=UPI003BC3CD9D
MKLKLGLVFKIGLAGLFLVLSILFFYQQRHECVEALYLLRTGSLFWILVGISLTVLYILLQGYMYVASFETFYQRVSMYSAVKLFLKRNLIAVFLPAGGVTSLLFFTKDLEHKGVDKTTIHKASYVYGIMGIVSLLLLALPVLWIFNAHAAGDYWVALASLVVLMGLFVGGSLSLAKQGWLYGKVVAAFPAVAPCINRIVAVEFSKKYLVKTLLISLFIELVGIVHLYVSMWVLGLEWSWEASVIGYCMGTLLYCFSPFLKGMGAVEVSMTWLLSRYGYSGEQAISITLMYRIFEFWLPLIAGFFSFFVSRNSILLRMFPAFFIFSMGIVNMVSVLTPSIFSRVHLLHEFLPLSGMYVSNALILVMGVLLVLCSIFLLRGTKSSWYVALVLSLLSLVGNITKALDYEESFLFLMLIVVLVITKKHYFITIRKNSKVIDWKIAVLVLAVVLAYGITGFYYLRRVHFNMDFNLWNAVHSTCNSFLLLNDNIAAPQTNFARMFLYSINFLGVGSLVLLLYAVIRPQRKLQENAALLQKDRAQAILDRYGRSPLDYFKLYKDKELYFSEHTDGFVAYRRHLNRAIVLEGPVCASDRSTTLALLQEFEGFCKRENLRPAYYRVDENDVQVFEEMGKKRLPIGQEAIVDLSTFSLEGKKRKSLRNAVNSIEKKGFISKIYHAPISNNMIQQLQQVSDNWLKDMKRKERVFAQGMFSTHEIKQHDIITLEDEEGKVVAFLNIIPDYTPCEATYDLIRKIDEAPGGNMDMLILKLIEYCRAKGVVHLNLGLAPFAGMENTNKWPCRIMHYLYCSTNFFKAHRGLKSFKEKFDPQWRAKFLVYDYDYDLVAFPLVMYRAMQVDGPGAKWFLNFNK